MACKPDKNINNPWDLEDDDFTENGEEINQVLVIFLQG